jgi:hypothetical protein
MPTVADFDTALHREIGAFRYDPLGFVMFAFPWGIPHTPLADASGPEEWQRDVLVKLGNGLLDRHFGEAESEAVRIAIASGVHDRLNQLGCPNLVGVDFGARADRTDASDAAARYANKRAAMWGFMKEWLKVGSLPDDNELLADLKAVDYGYDASDAILLEREDDMRRRGLASPDDGDALALTFAYPVAKRDWAEERRFDEALQKLKRWVV